MSKPQTKKNQRNSKNLNQVVAKSNGVKGVKKRNIENDIMHDLDKSIDMEKKSDKFLTVFLPVLLSIILLYLFIRIKFKRTIDIEITSCCIDAVSYGIEI